MSVISVCYLPWEPGLQGEGSSCSLLLDTGEMHLKYYPLSSKGSMRSWRGFSRRPLRCPETHDHRCAQGAVSSYEEEPKGSSNSHLQLLERAVVKMMEPNSLVVRDGARSNGHIAQLRRFRAVPVAPLQAEGWAGALQSSFVITASGILWRAHSNFRVKCAAAV